jgi:NADH-quinone oxidoreductase subunit E
MTQSLNDEHAEAGARPHASFSSASGDPAGFDGWTTQGGPPIPPLIGSPTASVAAAAAVGFGFATHFAGFLLGAMQGFMEASQKAAAEATRQQDQGVSGQPAEAGATRAPATEDVPARRGRPAGVAPADEPGVIAAQAAEATASVLAAASAAAQEKAAGRSPRARRARIGDDLKQIEGIGPKLEQVLKSMDVTRFAQLAAWDEAVIAHFETALGVGGRIVRDRWVEQAKALL